VLGPRLYDTFFDSFPEKGQIAASARKPSRIWVKHIDGSGLIYYFYVRKGAGSETPRDTSTPDTLRAVQYKKCRGGVLSKGAS